MKSNYLLSLFFTSAAIISAVPAICETKGKPTKATANISPESTLESAKIAYMNYDFTEAASLYNKYRQLCKRVKQTPNSEIDQLEYQLENANNFLERVEKIAIIDSLSVDKNDFFKHYRLPTSAGHIKSTNTLPYDLRNDSGDVLFLNENEDLMLWAAPDSTGHRQIVESIKLTDDSWSNPSPISDNLSENGDNDYPFMMADGVTLYFANNGNESIGGYDIFVATRDTATDSYLQPRNIGMPYNSPYDDYMLAIDELNGIGWWATDRNQLDDKLTIYVFVPNELRRNYDSDIDDIESYARISDYKATQEGQDYSELIKEISEISTSTVTKKEDFRFPIGGGKIYTTLNDFKSTNAKNLMSQYLLAQKDLDETESNLRILRQQYKKNKANSLVPKISTIETSLEQKRIEIKKLRNKILKIETNRN
jgi:hypothetical protein